jgi:hypothetical protein
MSRIRLIAMIGGTAASALAIGYFMQQGQPAAGTSAAIPAAPAVQTESEPAATIEDRESLDIRSVTLTSASPEADVPRPVIWPGAGAVSADPPPDPATPVLGCSVSATATPVEMASVDLAVTAPCYGNERVSVHHNGMIFTETTDAAGNLRVTVPALNENAVFIIAFGNGAGTVALAQVPTLANYDRVVVQWTGDTGLQVNAREFGAAYGDAGHVWAGSAPVSAKDSEGSRGSIVRLGNPDTLGPKIVEIYTFPTGVAKKSGTIALSVEAEVTAANCGREISAQSLELRGSAPLRARSLELSMPNCSAIGDFLVLNNLLDDLKIAAR